MPVDQTGLENQVIRVEDERLARLMSLMNKMLDWWRHCNAIEKECIVILDHVGVDFASFKPLRDIALIPEKFQLLLQVKTTVASRRSDRATAGNKESRCESQRSHDVWSNLSEKEILT